MGAAASSRPSSRQDNVTESRKSLASPRSKPEKRDNTDINAKTSDTEKNNSPDTGHPPSGTDLMISYSHADKETMLKVREGFLAQGLSVWVDLTGLPAGSDFLSKIGQAIIDSTMFIQLLSEKCIQSKYCQDELALAYISNKPIFPIALQSPDVLFPKMDTGMKLQLARFNWNPLMDEGTFNQDLDAIIGDMKRFLDEGTVAVASGSQAGAEGRPKLQRQNTHWNVNRHFSKTTTFAKKIKSFSEALDDSQTTHFWKTHFQNKDSVPWDKFQTAFRQEYQKVLDIVFSKNDQEWLTGILFGEICPDEQDQVTYENFVGFCTVDGEVQTFWERVQDQAVESYTMKEVFDMKSTVRVEAIDNLGKFRSNAVVEALRDLLRDKDNNIRAVAAISLARTGDQAKRTFTQLTRCLDDKDRLVRESACLALGHLQAKEAVPKILHLWRNDFISSVREAAQLALEQIGGEEANNAMVITRVLSEEIRMLTKE